MTCKNICIIVLIFLQKILKDQKVIVIGAGPAGMMAAGIAAQNSSDVIIIERNERLGRKILITGKGRCNVTNNCDVISVINSIPSNGRFLYSAINQFTPQDTIGFFESQGVALKTERGNRVFPESDRAKDIADALEHYIKNQGVKIINDRVKELMVENKKIVGVKTSSGDIINADKVVIACGGKSYPKTGSTGDGYTLARRVGHHIIEPKPSLVPLVASQSWCQELSGLSLKNVEISVLDKKDNKIVYKDFGEMLFTHFGLSGPIILSASAHMKDIEKDKYSVSIDLKPALTEDQLEKRVMRDFNKNINKDFSNALNDLLPQKLIPIIINISLIPPNTKCNSITKQMRKNFVRTLKNLIIDIDSFRPIDEAIITSGGVDTREINPKTMESKIISGLYFAGEVIDVDAYTGGFNLQIAFSTGYLAGNQL